ncbi:hypothetical protein PVAG01_07094 [Phlyctema vagabunda]|uniref:DUF6590 domain-containing protein n=1 Tax=Phlyctema vagabunda TaxID=108571 RepID=A0ABR4PBG3_9HELO
MVYPTSNIGSSAVKNVAQGRIRVIPQEPPLPPSGIATAAWNKLSSKKHVLDTPFGKDTTQGSITPRSYAAVASSVSAAAESIQGTSTINTSVITDKPKYAVQCENGKLSAVSVLERENANLTISAESQKNLIISAESQKSVTWSSGRSTDTVYGDEDYRQGTIFSTITHEEDLLRTAPEEGDSNRSVSAMGGTVYSKYRKFVVISCFARHVIALPIFTHNGRGLQNKPNKDEYISVRDWDLKHVAAPAENDHGVLWAQRIPAFRNPNVSKWHMMNDCTSIYITSPYTHKKDNLYNNILATGAPRNSKNRPGRPAFRGPPNQFSGDQRFASNRSVASMRARSNMYAPNR